MRSAAATLQVLAASPEVETALRADPRSPAAGSEVAAFRDRAVQAVRTHPSALLSLSLALPDGTAVASTARPVEASLPSLATVARPENGAPPDAMERWAEILAGDGASAVGVFRGVLVDRDVVAVGAPVRRNGAVLGGIIASLPLDGFLSVLRSVEPPAGWAVAVVDQHGLIVARDPPAPGYLGRRAPEEVLAFQAGGDPQGMVETVRPDGVTIHAALARTGTAPWLVAFSAPRDLVDAPVWRSVVLAAAGGTLAAALAATAALTLGRRLQRDLKGLAADAARLASGDPAADPIPPARTAEVAIARAAFDRAGASLSARDAERRELLATLDLGAAMAREWDGTIRHWSKGWERLYGWTADEAVGRVSHDLLRTVFPMPLSGLEAALARDGEWSGELRHHARDGREVVTAARKVLRRDAEGRPVAVVESLADVTAERRAEAALRDSEARLRAAQEAAEVGVFERDLGAGRSLWSPTMFRLYGLAPDSFPDGAMPPRAYFALLDPRDVRGLRAARAAFLAGPAARFAFDFRIRRADTGETRWIASRGEVDRDPATGRAVRGVGVNYDVTVRRQAEERLHLMVDELNHRVKNTLATVQSIASQTLRGADAGLRDALDDRLLALAAAHDVLTREGWAGAGLDEVAADVLAPYGGADGGRLRVSGPPIRLTPRAAVGLSMGLHELTTNALKHGALRGEGGHVDLRWEIVPGIEPRFRLVWAERGGPPVVAPTRRGFGTRLVETILPRDLSGTATLDFAPEGLACTIEAPLAAVSAPAVVAPLPRLGPLAGD